MPPAPAAATFSGLPIPGISACEHGQYLRAQAAVRLPMKKAARAAFQFLDLELPRLLDVGGLLSLGPLHHVEADFLAFLEGLEAGHVDRREMREQVLAAVVGRDETIAFRVVEPLHGACCHALSLIAVDLSYRATSSQLHDPEPCLD